MRSGGVSLQSRAFVLGALLALGAASVATALAAPPAGAASASTTGPAITAPCGSGGPGHASCLVQMFHPGRGLADNTPAARFDTSPQTSTPTGLSPTQILGAYGFPKGGGAGETIAIVDAYGDPTIASNLSTFSTHYGLPACTTSSGCFTKVSQTGGTAPTKKTAGWDLETSLDVEWAHAIAPDAHVLLVEATTTTFTNMFAAVTYAASHATYVSMSWGSTKESSTETSYDSYFTKHPNVSFFAASGDTASHVGYPSASPDVISVGGTTLTVTSTGTWEAETAWSTAGGGCSTVEAASEAQAGYPTYAQVTCGGKRATPDVSLDANPDTGVAVYDTTKVTGLVDWIQVGGTSASTIMIASRAADTGTRIDATSLYGHKVPIYNVTSGSNGHPCEVGYNLCTGLGSWNTAHGVTAALTFTSSSQSLTAGTESATPLEFDATPASTATFDVTLSTSSAHGGFSTTPNASTFTRTITVPITDGTGNGSASVYYEDTTAGTPTITASASGYASATQTETVAPVTGTAAALSVSPTKASLISGATQTFTATARDKYGNAWSDPSVSWNVTGSIGKLSTDSGASVTLTAGSSSTSGSVTASVQGGPSASAAVTVTAEPAVKVSVAAGTVKKAGTKYEVPLKVTATGTSSKDVSGGEVTLDVYSGGTCSGTVAASGSGKTNSAGTISFTFSTTTAGTYCAEATVTASGYAAGTGTVSFSIGASASNRSRSSEGEADEALTN